MSPWEERRGGRLAERVYRVLLYLYPRAFRREFEPAMVEAFHARRRAARSRDARTSSTAFWWLILRDLAASVAAARRGRIGPGTGRGSAPGRGSRPGRGSGPGLLADLRSALRRTGRQPGFTAVIVLVLALGIGGATTVFSVVNGVLLRALPYADADRIVRLWAELEEEGIEGFSFTKVEFRHFFEFNQVFASVGGDFPTSATITGDGEPERLRAAFVTPGYFEIFGTRPALGRFIDFDDVDDGRLDIVVISHGLWQRRLGGRDDVVGERLILDDRAFTVVGVLPADYRHLDDDYDLFVPYTLGTDGWIARWLGLSARLEAGVTIERAQADVDAMMAALAEEQPRSRDWAVRIEPVGEWAVQETRRSLLVILGAVGLVLLLACANVANLLLARASTLRHETAMRLAMGASPARIARHHLAEGLVLAAMGGALGIAAAYAGLPLVLELGAHALPRLTDISVDARVLAAALAMSLLSGVLFGLAPAAYAYRAVARRSMSPRSASVVGQRGSHRILDALIVAEVALALAVLVGAGLFLRSFNELRNVDIGVDPERVVVASISLPAARYAEAAAVHTFYDELLARVGAMPGVESASIAAYLPLDGEGAITSLTTAERLQRGLTERVATLQRVVRKDYFRTLGIPLLRGRNFDESQELANAGQLIVSQSLAELFWPGEDPIGKRVTSSTEPAVGDWREIIGVVGDVRYVDLESEPQPQIYESHFERPWREAWLVSRTTGGTGAFAAELRRITAELDPQVPVADFRSMQAIAREAVAGPRFSLLVLVSFAITGTLLACAGIYGVVAFVVGQRRCEIGVRMALGASRAGVVAHSMRRAMRPVLVGVGLGVLLAVFSSRLLEGALYGVSPLDPVTYGVAAFAFALVGGLASWLPSRRAATVDPMIVIRDP